MISTFLVISLWVAVCGGSCGTLQLGEACGDECNCDISASLACSNAKCLGSDGFHCTSDGDCAGDRICYSVFYPLMNKRNTCGPLIADGQSCGADYECGDNSGASICYGRGHPTEANKCGPLGALNAGCGADYECDTSANLACDNHKCLGDTSFDCSVGGDDDCVSTLFCRSAGYPTPADRSKCGPLLADGQQCGGSYQCGGNGGTSICYISVHPLINKRSTCGPLIADGQSCGADYECGDNSGASICYGRGHPTEANKCGPLGVLNAGCGADYECDTSANLACDNHKCLGDISFDCSVGGDDDCVSVLVCYSADHPNPSERRKCGPPLTDGQECGEDYECGGNSGDSICYGFSHPTQPNRCGPLGEMNAECGAHDHCVSTLVCYSADYPTSADRRRCGRPGEKNAQCGADDDCVGSYVCDTTCRETGNGTLGAKCELDGDTACIETASVHCASETGVCTLRCQSASNCDEGTACALDEQCANILVCTDSLCSAESRPPRSRTWIAVAIAVPIVAVAVVAVTVVGVVLCRRHNAKATEGSGGNGQPN